MRKSTEDTFWVVYKMTIDKHPEGMNAVCKQAEWEAMEFHRPRYHTLVRGGIGSEAEAERLARGTLGDRPVGRLKPRASTPVAY